MCSYLVSIRAVRGTTYTNTDNVACRPYGNAHTEQGVDATLLCGVARTSSLGWGQHNRLGLA